MHFQTLLLVLTLTSINSIRVQIRKCESAGQGLFSNIQLYKKNQQTFQFDISDRRINKINIPTGQIVFYQTTDLFEYRFQSVQMIKDKIRYFKAAKQSPMVVAFIIHNAFISETRGQYELRDILTSINGVCFEKAPIMVEKKMENVMFCCEFQAVNRMLL